MDRATRTDRPLHSTNLTRGRVVHRRIAGTVEYLRLLAPPSQGFQTAVVPPQGGNVTAVHLVGAVQQTGEEFGIKVLLEVLPGIPDGRRQSVEKSPVPVTIDHGRFQQTFEEPGRCDLVIA